MKWGMRVLGCLDLFTFLIFIYPKSIFLISTFTNSFSIPQKASALSEVMILCFFALSGYLIFWQKQTGLLISFVQIPFRFIYLYFSFDFLSYLAYYLGFQNHISTETFQNNWFYFLMVAEVFRYAVSAYWYNKQYKQ
jgi:hypothetical protein